MDPYNNVDLDRNRSDVDRSSPSQVQPAMDNPGEGQTTNTQGFDNPAFEKREAPQSEKTGVNGNAPGAGVYGAGGKYIIIDIIYLSLC